CVRPLPRQRTPFPYTTLFRSKMQAQAEKFGATVIYDDATSVDLAAHVKTVTTAEGHIYRARAVILANGSAYKELGLDGESEMTRSEEHTSELQSRFDLVCRLL